MLIVLRRLAPILFIFALIELALGEAVAKITVQAAASGSGYTLDSARWLAGLIELYSTNHGVGQSAIAGLCALRIGGVFLWWIAEVMIWRRASDDSIWPANTRQALLALAAIAVQTLYALPFALLFIVPAILAWRDEDLHPSSARAMVAVVWLGLSLVRVIVDAARAMAISRQATPFGIRTLPRAAIRILRAWKFGLVAWLVAAAQPLLAGAAALIGMTLAMDGRHALIMSGLVLISVLFATVRKTIVARMVIP
jgi:hypothetical protein